MVTTEGARASPAATRRRRREITEAGGSPAAQAASASWRRSGHVYDPHRGLSGTGVTIRLRCRSKALWRRDVMHPAPFHTCINDTIRSRPTRDVRNA